jgi:hypothetical protein
MTVIPSHLPPIDPSRFQQEDAARQVKLQDPSTAPQQMQDVDPVDDAEEVGFGMVTRGMSKIALQQQSSVAKKRDGRQHFIQIVRLARLKGMNPAFDESFWRNEVAVNADEMLTMARRGSSSSEQLAGGAVFEDPFKRYLFLLVAKQRTEPDEPASKKLDDAMDRIWVKHELEIESAFNTMVPMWEFVRDEKEWDAFRGIYIDYIVPGELALSLKALLERFGPGRIAAVIDALRKAMAFDLNSRIICLNTERWRQEMLDLVDNRRIAGLIGGASDFCREVQGRDPDPETVLGLVTGALDLAAGPNPRKLDGLCAMLKPGELVSELLRGRVRAYLNKCVPLWLWSSPDARDSILFTVMHRGRG